MVKGVVCKREQRKLGCLVESRMDAEVAGGLFSSPLYLGAVYVCDIFLSVLEQALGQLVPMCCHFWDFLST